MCGICGIINHKNNSDYKKIVERMRDNLSHRGPDQKGLFIDEKVALGHTRLSVIDLSNNASQPMSNNSKSIIIVYNGEIYNFKELRSSLIKLGYKFRSKSDTEVIIHGYTQWGDKILNKLNGMFAFALYDKEKNRTIIARDHVGQKPLWYINNENSIIFSSEFSSLMEYLQDTPDINMQTVIHYLSFLMIPSEMSIVNGINKLEPGHYLIFEKGHLVKKQYWDISFAKQISLNEPDIVRALDFALSESISRHIVCDVPIGTFLSGGLDSSLITAMATKELGEGLHTFSVGFENNNYDESYYAKLVSEKFKTTHHDIKLDSDCLNVLPKLIKYYGEPFADSSCIPTYYVSKEAKKFVTVVLSGDGADEFFGGYSVPIRNYFYNYFRKFIPKKNNSIINDPMENISSDFFRFMPIQLQRILIGLRESSIENYINRNIDGWFWNREKLLKKYENIGIQSFYEKIYDSQNTCDINRLLYLNIKTSLPNDMLTKVDIASMANSLEVRCPFLDIKVMELAASIKPKYKFRFKEGKRILKKVAIKYLPQEVVWRNKMGFSIPLSYWMREEKWQAVISNILDNSYFLRENFENNFIQDIWIQHKSGKVNHEKKIWSIIWLALWYEMFFNKTLNASTKLDEYSIS